MTRKILSMLVAAVAALSLALFIAAGEAGTEDSRILLIDAHLHDLVRLRDRDFEQQLDPERMMTDGIGAVVMSVPTDGRRNAPIIGKISGDIDRISENLERYEGMISIAGSSGEIVDRWKDGRYSVMLSVEYFGGLFEGGVNVVDTLYDFGIRSAILREDEDYDDDGTSGEDRRITPLCRDIISRMNDLGMAIDITHMTDDQQMAVIEASRAPVMISHSNLRSVYGKFRNVSDDVLQALSARDGMIMVTFCNEMIADSAKAAESAGWVDLLADHIDHAVGVAGIDHVGIGSDFGGSGTMAPDELKDAGAYGAIFSSLEKKGYARDELEKIMGMNFIHLLESVEKAGSR